MNHAVIYLKNKYKTRSIAPSVPNSMDSNASSQLRTSKTNHLLHDI